jgi:hypothetical protein
MKHENLLWNAATREWFCTRCGRTSDNASVFEAQSALERYECHLPSVTLRNPPAGTETTRLMRKQVLPPKIERGGSRFVAVLRDHGPEIRLELFHELPSMATFSIGFEMLRGVTLPEAKKLVEMMNERIVGVIVSPK